MGGRKSGRNTGDARAKGGRAAKKEATRVKGSLQHAEGQHGEKTRARFLEQLQGGAARASRDESLQEQRRRGAVTGKRRLVEDRQQHDEAEKNSEHTQLFEEYQRGRADGPSDNSGNLHGVLEHREHRADNKLRDSKGLTKKRRRGGTKA